MTNLTIDETATTDAAAAGGAVRNTDGRSDNSKRRLASSRQQRRPLRPRGGLDFGCRGERGSTTMFIAVLALGFIMCAGLAIDGGRKLGALSEARDLADNAARAGAQQVDLDAHRSGGVLALDATAAHQAAMDYLAGVGESGTAVVSGQTITVTVTMTATRRFLPGNMTVSAVEDASAIPGILEAFGD